MITKEQALTANIFHEVIGYQYKECAVWRRHGATKIWKRSPKRFVIPVKYGLYNYRHITESNAGNFHIEGDPTCPLVSQEA